VPSRAAHPAADPVAAAAIQSNRQLRSTVRFGFLLAITCTEDVSRIDPRTIEHETAHTYLGDTRVREQIAARADWPRGTFPDNYGDPVRTNVPVFLLPGTSIPWRRRDSQPTPRGIDAMERAFLDAANPRAVDRSCVAQMRLPDFVTARPSFR
jgi:hypothetical protein